MTSPDFGYWLTGTLVVYIAVCIYLGYLGMKRTKTVKDFALAGQAASPLILGLALYATWHSISAYMGSPGLAYNFGWPSMWQPWAIILIQPILLILLAGRIRTYAKKLNVLSAIDLIGERFQSHLLRVVFALVTVVTMTMYCVSQYKGAGLIFSNVFGTEFWVGVVIAAAVVMFYMSTGGAWADIYTDAFQGVLMILIVLIMVPVSVIAAGGYATASANLAAIKPELAGIFYPGTLYDSWAPITISLYFTVLFFGNPLFPNRVMALKDKKHVARFIVLFAIGNFLGAWFQQVGALGRSMGVAVSTADFITPQLMINLLPVPLAAILIVGILAAMMSSVDGYANAAAVSAGNDVYRRIWTQVLHRPDDAKIDRRAVLIMRIVTIVVLVVPIYWVVVAPPPFLSLFIYYAGGFLVSSVCAPFLVGLLWKGATKLGAYAAVICGLAGFELLDIFMNKMTVWAKGVSGAAISFAAILLVSYIENKFFGGRTLPREALKKLEGE